MTNESINLSFLSCTESSLSWGSWRWKGRSPTSTRPLWRGLSLTGRKGNNNPRLLTLSNTLELLSGDGRENKSKTSFVNVWFQEALGSGLGEWQWRRARVWCPQDQWSGSRDRAWDTCRVSLSSRVPDVTLLCLQYRDQLPPWQVRGQGGMKCTDGLENLKCLSF